MPKEFSQQEFEDMANEVTDRLRKMGLYVDEVAMGEAQEFGSPFLIAVATVGDLAFSDRVLNPEQERFNDEFRNIQVEENSASFDAMRERMKRNIEEGRDPLDDGE